MLITYKKPRGRFFIVGKGGSGPVPPTPSQPNDEIWYTSTDDQVVTPNQPGGILDENGNTLNILSNTYSDGKGVIKLDGDVVSFVPVDDYGVFDSCATLASVSIPDSVTSIGNYTFYHCSNLASVTIGNSVSSFGDDAFEDCNNLAYVNYTGTVDQWCEINFAEDTSNPTMYAKTLSINGSLLTEVVISDAVTSIGKYVFYNCKNITSVTVGNSVTTIGNGAFSGCSGMTSATIGSSVASIGNNAFSRCTSLVAIESLPTTAPSISSYTFNNVGQNGVLTVHNADYSTWMSTGNNYLGKYNWTCVGGLFPVTVTGQNGTVSVTVSGVTTTGNYSASLPAGTVLTFSVTPDQDAHFSWWVINNGTDFLYSNPDTYTISSNTDIIGHCILPSYFTVNGESGKGKVSFEGSTPDYTTTQTVNSGNCYTLQAYPDQGYEFVQWTSDDMTFDDATANPITACTSWTEGYTTVVNAVFQAVTPQQPNDEIWYTSTDGQVVTPYAVDFGSGVTMLSNTYTNGKGIIKLSSDATTIGKWVFDHINLTSIEIPNSVITLNDYAFRGTNLTSITIPDNVTTIGVSCFEVCNNLSVAIIGSNVTNISSSAFRTTALTSITFTSTTTVPTLGMMAFYNVASTGTVYGQSGLDYSTVMAALPSGWTLVQ